MRDLLSDAEAAALLSDPNPMKRAQKQMLTPMPKRFYKAVTVFEGEGEWQVLLDGKPVRTPAKKVLALPSERAAKLVADEFDAQKDEINPALMPVTRLANTAIDGVSTEMEAVREDILRYAGNDMLCYRAEGPDGLVLRQTELWDPYLDWVKTRHGARFYLAEGVMHVAQPKEAIALFNQALGKVSDPISMAILHTFTSMTGSAILALALLEGESTAETIWKVAHLEEDWTNDQWGEDSEAQARRANRWIDFDAADRLLKAIQKS